MKSNPRLTKQGIPDLNYYGPRPKAAVPAEETPGTSPAEAAGAADEATQVAETPRDTDILPT